MTKLLLMDGAFSGQRDLQSFANRLKQTDAVAEKRRQIADILRDPEQCELALAQVDTGLAYFRSCARDPADFLIHDVGLIDRILLELGQACSLAGEKGWPELRERLLQLKAIERKTRAIRMRLALVSRAPTHGTT